MTYPRMKPTIDITAAVLPYACLQASQVVGSGKVSKNHSWKIGGILSKNRESGLVILGDSANYIHSLGKKTRFKL